MYAYIANRRGSGGERAVNQGGQDMNMTCRSIPKRALLIVVIAVIMLFCAFALSTRDAYAQTKNVPFEQYIGGINDGVALMNSMMVIDLEYILKDKDPDMAAAYRSGKTIKMYVRGVESDILDSNFADREEADTIHYSIFTYIDFSGLHFKFYIEIGDWTFVSNEVMLLYNINMATYSDFQDKTYNGKAQYQTPVVTERGYGQYTLVEGRDYTVSYSNNVNAGTATVTFRGIPENYVGGEYTRTFTIKKAAGAIQVKGKTVKVKHSKVKKKKQTIKASKVFKVSKKIGKVTYKKVSGNKKITVATGGKVTVKKGLKKGTYPVKVIATAAGDKNHLKATKTITFKVKVK